MTTPPMPTGGQPVTDRIPEGTIVGERYRIHEVLGVGGMAIVYKAEDQLLKRPVAIKVMADWLRSDESYARRFTEEAQSAARLNHPNVVTVYDTEQDGNRRYIVMEFVDGRSLKEYLDEVAILDEADAVDVAIQMADALEYGHQNGIIHCDVKPGNILVDRRGRAKIVDFGIARAATQTWAMATTVLGTAAYMAPENVEGTRPDARSDVYSLGLVLYEMLAGRLPFEGESVAAVTAQRLVKDPIPLRRFNQDVTPQLERIIMQTLARDPALRPQTSGQLAEMLRRHAGGGAVALGGAAPVMAPPPSSRTVGRGRPAPISGPPRRRRGSGGFLTALAVIIIAVALFAIAFVATEGLLGASGDDDDDRNPAGVTSTAGPTVDPPDDTATAGPPATETATPEPTETATPEPTEEPPPEPTVDPCMGMDPCMIITPGP